MARRYFIDESVKPASLYVVDGEAMVAEAHELERASTVENVPPPKTFEEMNVMQKDGLMVTKDLKDEAEEIVGGKKQRRCKLCGKPGHRKDTCPENPEKKSNMSEETREKLNDAPVDEQELVWDIRSQFVVQKKSPLAVCNELNITMEEFNRLCKEYDIHR